MITGLKINVKIDKGAYMPEYAHKTDAGADLRSPVNVVIMPHDSVVINSGVHMEIPEGFVGNLKSKSGLNVKHDIVGEGVIDSGYTGPICVKLYNLGNKPYMMKRGDKMIQIEIVPVIFGDFNQVDVLEKTERGENGFGSTGR